VTSAVREFDRRVEPGLALVESAEEIARACHAMAARFHRGGKLLVFGNGGGATDAEHIAVEFVHPVGVGKIALPALSLAADPTIVTGIAAREGFAEIFAHQLRQLGDPTDIAIGVSSDGRCANVRRGLEQARELGLLTVALTGGDGGALATSPAVDHLVVVPSDDPQVVKEMHVTTYHVLWELVHVFFEHPGVLTDIPGGHPRTPGPAVTP
jgi:D-sedoheptulose 7-phosphate isomerase